MNPNDTVTLRELTDFVKLLTAESRRLSQAADAEPEALIAVRLNCEGIGIITAAELLLRHFKLLEPAT